MNKDYVPKIIVIGFDGSEASGAIFDDLPMAGLPADVTAVVVTAADILCPLVAPEELTPEWMKSIEAEREAKMAAAVATVNAGMKRLKMLFPGWKVTAQADSNGPAWALIETAEKTDADLIVVGAHGHAASDRFLGSVSQQVLIHAPCSVRVSRPPTAILSAALPRVLVASDTSREAAAAISVAANRPWLPSTAVRVLSVIPPWEGRTPVALESPKIPVAPFQDNLRRRRRERFLEVAAQALESSGHACSSAVLKGDPKSVIVKEADLWSASTVLLGARGLSAVRRLLLGSTSLAVAARAGCSVEVVRVKKSDGR